LLWSGANTLAPAMPVYIDSNLKYDWEVEDRATVTKDKFMTTKDNISLNFENSGNIFHPHPWHLKQRPSHGIIENYVILFGNKKGGSRINAQQWQGSRSTQSIYLTAGDPGLKTHNFSQFF